MRVTNMIFHIFSAVLLGIDILIMGFNFLMGLTYMDGTEILQAGLLVALLFISCAASVIGIPVSASKKISPKKYKIVETILHCIAVLGFGVMILMVIKINIFHATHKVKELSTGYTNFSPIDLAGFALGIIGIVITQSGSRKFKANR